MGSFLLYYVFKEVKIFNQNILEGLLKQKEFVELRVLNDTEEVDNLYVSNKTLFINDSLMILKGVDGSLEKWEVKKIYPIDKKDEKISQLESEIQKLKEMINNESTKSDESTKQIQQSDGDVKGNVDK